MAARLYSIVRPVGVCRGGVGISYSHHPESGTVAVMARRPLLEPGPSIGRRRTFPLANPASPVLVLKDVRLTRHRAEQEKKNLGGQSSLISRFGGLFDPSQYPLSGVAILFRTDDTAICIAPLSGAVPAL